MLDYAFEVEHFDKHLLSMLNLLEAKGQLENTLIVVMADNGMPFPRGKGQEYEISNHLPLAIRWPAGIKFPGRVVEDYASVIDLAPTFLEVAGLSWKDSGLAPAAGRSLIPVLQSERSGRTDPARDHVLLGRERNDVGRPGDAGYPIRSIVKNGVLFSKNYEPNRWPGCNPETGYLDCDSSPTKTEILHAHRKNSADPFWALAFGIRVGEELFELEKDPDCVKNKAAEPAFESLKKTLQSQMDAELTAQEDPRLLGRGAEFDAYPYAGASARDFYNRFKSGERTLRKGALADDFEQEPLQLSPPKE